MTHSMTRRGALAALASAAGAAALPLAAGPAAAQFGPSPFGGGSSLPAGLRFGDIAVDASRLARLGNPGDAERVTTVLTRQLREVYADITVPRGTGGATLVARISSISMPSYVGSRAYNGKDGGGGNDSLEGVGIVASGRQVLGQVPILSVLSPTYSGSWYQPDIEAKRLVSICHHFAWWLRREMGV